MLRDSSAFFDTVENYSIRRIHYHCTDRRCSPFTIQMPHRWLASSAYILFYWYAFQIDALTLLLGFAFITCTFHITTASPLALFLRFLLSAGFTSLYAYSALSWLVSFTGLIYLMIIECRFQFPQYITKYNNSLLVWFTITAVYFPSLWLAFSIDWRCYADTQWCLGA